MPILTDIPETERKHTVLLYGPSKSGKTEAVGRLAEDGYNLHWFDTEDGSLTLEKLSPAAKSRIHLYKIRDTAQNSYAAKTLLRVLNFRTVTPQKICWAHGLLMCPTCTKDKPEAFDIFDSTKLAAPKDIVVIDSLTQLSDSILNSMLPDVENKPEFDHWRGLGVKLDSIMDWMKATRCHVIMISHEQEVEMEDGKLRLTAVGGTKNYARSLPRHFSHVLYASVNQKKHSTVSKSTAMNGVVTGSRTDADTGTLETAPLSAIFPKLSVA